MDCSIYLKKEVHELYKQVSDKYEMPISKILRLVLEDEDLIKNFEKLLARKEN